MDQYKKSIIESYKFLNSSRDELFTHALNLAMAGELKEIDEAFEMGDSFNFEIDQFKGTQDLNLNELVNLYEQMVELISRMATVNGIKEEDLEE